jgi:hypothetical protein
MPSPHADLVPQRVPTAVGMLEIALPAGAALRPDPGADEGGAWWWSPEPAAVLTINHGEARLRTPAQLLMLERSLAGVSVEVLRDEPGDADGERSLEFVSRHTATRPFTMDAGGDADGGGHGHPPADTAAGQRARFRFWQHTGSALRVGYRLDEPASARWRATLDEILDSARLQ